MSAAITIAMTMKAQKRREERRRRRKEAEFTGDNVEDDEGPQKHWAEIEDGGDIEDLLGIDVRQSLLAHAHAHPHTLPHTPALASRAVQGGRHHRGDQRERD